MGRREAHEQIMELLDGITDEKHLKCKMLHRIWCPGQAYTPGDISENIVLFNDKLYRFIGTEEHISAEEYNPERANYLWVEITDPSIEFPEWKQPLGYADAYKKGDKVTCDEKKWISYVDGNTWKPGEYGWDEVAT